jgi:dipeptidyl-peptidase-4
MIQKLRYYVISVFLPFSFFLFAQDNQLTLRDCVYLNPEVLPKTINQLNWIGEGNDFSYIDDNKLIKGIISTGERKTVATLADINAGLEDMESDSMDKFPSVSFVDEHTLKFVNESKLFVFDIISKNLTFINYYYDGGKNVDICDETYAIAYTIDNDLIVALNSEQIQITKNDSIGVVNGHVVHRNEFGITKGTFWSPKGNYLAYYRKDESLVTNYPLVDISKRVAIVKNTRYPMAGMESEFVTLGIYDIKEGKTIFINTGEPLEQYLTSVTWDPSEKFIYIGILNREQNHLRLNKYNAVTGEFVYTLFEEKSEKYVEPENPLYFLHSNSSQFLWFSERDGYQHLYLYNVSGHLVKQLTSGNWVVSDIIGIDEDDKFVYFTGTMESPIEQNIYSVEIRTGKITRISKDHGTHIGLLSHSGDFIFDIYSSTDVTREYKLFDGAGNVIEILQKNEDPLKDYRLGETSIFTLKADDGSDLYCRLIKPADFDPAKKYPVYYYVYGGPHSQLITDSWLGAAGLFQNYMAQQGYVVFTMDNRGTANRGLAFEQAIFRNLGTIEIADQMKGVEYLKSLNYVDQNRMGIDGWSYGGFLTISMILQHPGTFKIASAGGPVIDWKYYEVMYGERYMDTPKENPEGYKKAALTDYVDKLEDRLLIIQGAMDETVVWQNSLSFIKKCVDEGKQVEYFVYPGHEHNVRGKDRMHLYEKLRKYYDENLKD